MKKLTREEHHVPRANREITTDQLRSQEAAILAAAQMANALDLTPERFLDLGDAAVDVPIRCSVCGAIPPHDIRDKCRWARICEVRHRLKIQDLHATRGVPTPYRPPAQSRFRERKGLIQ